MKKLIIFGIGEEAELAYFYFTKEGKYEVCAFTVDEVYKTKETLFDKPIIPFESVTAFFPPAEYKIFIAIGYSKLNRIRAEKFNAAKEKNYDFASYISPKASIFTEKIGENCFILEDNTIQPFTEVGNNVTLWSGNHIGHHSIIKDHCFLASHVVISGRVTIGEFSFIGVNATLRDHIIIGKSNIIGAGALILNDTEDNKVYRATPTEPSRIPSNRLRGI